MCTIVLNMDYKGDTSNCLFCVSIVFLDYFCGYKRGRVKIELLIAEGLGKRDDDMYYLVLL